jgi:hypothetical protein
MASKNNSFHHSPDYRSVRLGHRTYAATKAQAVVVQVLHRAWLDGCPDVGDEYLRKAAGTTSDRLRDVFRAGDLWGNVIVAGSTRGTRRLAICAHEIPT